MNDLRSSYAEIITPKKEASTSANLFRLFCVFIYVSVFQINGSGEIEMILLSRSEEIVLLAIWKLKDNAYGVSLREMISQVTSHEWSFGSVYKPLKQLLHKGYVEKRSSEPRSERGGRARFLYTLTPAGREALKRIRKIHKAFWSEDTELAFD